MKTSFIVCICSIALAIVTFGQGSPTAPTSPVPAASISPAASVSPSGDLADRIHQRIEKKFKKHHGIVIDGHSATGADSDDDIKINSDEIPAMVVPIVAVTMLTIFGAPVLIVALIMYFGFSKSRMTQRTIRMMVEKGQPVPAALLNPPPPAARQRSDMRRGVILSMVGLGLMVWLGAVNDWEGGVWSLGLIPFLIGAGYLLVWKLEGKKDVSSPPPLP
jgi:Domain of unknown function (DUF6249)